MIIIECCMQISTKNTKIRSDLVDSCSLLPSINLRVALPHPLASFIMQVPSSDELPPYDSKAEAGVKLSKEVQKELLRSPRVRESNQLVDIARPFASDLKLLKPSLTCDFNQYVLLEFSLNMSCFCGVDSISGFHVCLS